jgi:hypothetical protein
MAENVQRSQGRPPGYKFDRGGTPTEMGPYIGIVVNNVDNTRQGRLQVYIDQFGAVKKDGLPNLTDSTLWRTVSYCPPFYGATPKSGTASGPGAYTPGNQQSYGMWFTPPDLGVQVLCFFVAGDPSQGYYVGCVPEQGINHMIPAIGSVPNALAVKQNQNQDAYFADAPRLPVTEINNAITNPGVNENPKFFDQAKPVHSYVAAVLFQQGLANDPVRGPIGSSSQRESPSSCYGISTPGRAIYQGGLQDQNATQQLDTQKPQDIQVIGRRGGHTLVMDDGDLEGNDNLIRIRTAKGHQITMSDDGNCFYITHANGQTWIELGQEGTVDVFSTNSVNVRTEGTINLHADQDINMYAGKNINLKSKEKTNIQADQEIAIATKANLTMFSKTKIGIKSNGTLALQGKQSSWNGGSTLNLNGSQLNLNGGANYPIDAVQGLTNFIQPNVNFNSTTGWQVDPAGTESIVTRAPCHEPWPYHNQGVPVTVNLERGQPTPPPAAPTIPPGTTITKTGNAATPVAPATQPTAPATQPTAPATQPTAPATAAPNPPTVDPQSVTWDPNDRASLSAANVALGSMADTLKSWFDQYGTISTDSQRASVGQQMSVVITKRQQILADVNRLNEGG